jgi:HD-GYP domain-containing protein (c-di-GMP phosphodiesterase class II)
MESHTVLGSELILQYVDAIGIMPAVVSFEHHLKYDLSGYPKLAFSKRPHIVSQIVSICDTFDALSERRSYKADYSPGMIYNLMVRGKGTTYNPALLDKFFRLIGVWPIGTIVSLNDKRIAVVVNENQDDIFSPLVRVIHPQKEEGVIDLKNNQAGLKIDGYLNPWREGKDFLHLI